MLTYLPIIYHVFSSKLGLIFVPRYFINHCANHCKNTITNSMLLDMSSTEEQLISFFAYSFLIYPITNYLVSPQRRYKRFYGVIFAILFLGTISYIQMV